MKCIYYAACRCPYTHEPDAICSGKSIEAIEKLWSKRRGELRACQIVGLVFLAMGMIGALAAHSSWGRLAMTAVTGVSILLCCYIFRRVSSETDECYFLTSSDPEDRRLHAVVGAKRQAEWYKFLGQHKMATPEFRIRMLRAFIGRRECEFWEWNHSAQVWELEKSAEILSGWQEDGRLKVSTAGGGSEFFALYPCEVLQGDWQNYTPATALRQLLATKVDLAELSRLRFSNNHAYEVLWRIACVFGEHIRQSGGRKVSPYAIRGNELIREMIETQVGVANNPPEPEPLLELYKQAGGDPVRFAAIAKERVVMVPPPD